MSELVNPETGEIVVSPMTRWMAFSKAQGAIEPPKKSKTANVRTRDGQSYSFDYAPLDAILECAKKPLADNDLSLSQRLVQHDGEKFLRTEIWHPTGLCVDNDYPIIVSGPTAQNFASGVTYARRYGLMLALGICAEEDDDGNIADGNTANISPRGGGSAAQTRRPPPQTQVQQPNPNEDAARAARERIKNAIELAKRTRDLDEAYTKEDEALIRSIVRGSDRIGDRVWQQLLEKEAERRIQLAEDDMDRMEPDDDGFLSPEDAGHALR